MPSRGPADKRLKPKYIHSAVRAAYITEVLHPVFVSALCVVFQSLLVIIMDFTHPKKVAQIKRFAFFKYILWLDLSTTHRQTPLHDTADLFLTSSLNTTGSPTQT